MLYFLCGGGVAIHALNALAARAVFLWHRRSLGEIRGAGCDLLSDGVAVYCSRSWLVEENPHGCPNANSDDCATHVALEVQLRDETVPLDAK